MEHEIMTVTRAHLGLPDLNLLDGGYSLWGDVIFTPQGVEKTVAETSPWVHGEMITHVRLTTGTYTIPVKITGASPAHANTLRNQVIAAFRQRDCVVTYRSFGITERYKIHVGEVLVSEKSRELRGAMAAKNEYLVTFTGAHVGTP